MSVPFVPRRVTLALAFAGALIAAGLTYVAGAPASHAASCAAPSKCEYDVANHHNSGGTGGCAHYMAQPRPATSGRGCFEHDGDILYMNDQAEDGYGIGIQWYNHRRTARGHLPLRRRGHARKRLLRLVGL